MSLIVQSEKYMTITVWKYKGEFQVQVKPDSKNFGGEAALVAAAEVASAMADWSLPQIRSVSSLEYRVKTIERLASVVGERWYLPSEQDRADAEIVAAEKERKMWELAERERLAEESARHQATVIEAADVINTPSDDGEYGDFAEGSEVFDHTPSSKGACDNPATVLPALTANAAGNSRYGSDQKETVLGLNSAQEEV